MWEEYRWIDKIKEQGLKGVFHVSGTNWGGDYIVGRVVRLESSGEILGDN